MLLLFFFFSKDVDIELWLSLPPPQPLEKQLVDWLKLVLDKTTFYFFSLEGALLLGTPTLP